MNEMKAIPALELREYVAERLVWNPDTFRMCVCRSVFDAVGLE